MRFDPGGRLPSLLTEHVLVCLQCSHVQNDRHPQNICMSECSAQPRPVSWAASLRGENAARLPAKKVFVQL